MGEASLEAVPPFFTTALPVIQGAPGWDVGLLCQQGLYLRSLQTSQARRKKMTLIQDSQRWGPSPIPPHLWVFFLELQGPFSP